MPLRYTYVPLGPWPGTPTPASRRTRSPFKVTWAAVERLLARELKMLGAADVTIAVDVPYGQIRQDGQLYANARATSPGVVLSFTDRRKQRQVWPCDRWSDWQHNLMAIGRSLEALRSVERYGVFREGQQYKGMLALPPAGGTTEGLGHDVQVPEPEMTTQDAAAIVSSVALFPARYVAEDAAVAEHACRLALNKLATGATLGGHAQERVTRAVAIVRAHHKAALNEKLARTA